MKKLAFTIGLALSTMSALAQTSTTSVSSSRSSISVSVSNTKVKYSYSASFDKEKSDDVRDLLIKILGKAREESTRTSYWESKGYAVELRKGKVEIEVNKELVTKSLLVKLEDLGVQISKVLGSVQTSDVG